MDIFRADLFLAWISQSPFCIVKYFCWHSVISPEKKQYCLLCTRKEIKLQNCDLHNISAFGKMYLTLPRRSADLEIFFLKKPKTPKTSCMKLDPFNNPLSYRI